MSLETDASWTCHGLVDASVTVTGYRESSLDSPDLAQQSLAALWAEVGVVGVRDAGSSVTANIRQREYCRATHVHGTGLVLVEGTPLGDGDVVLTESALDAALGIASAIEPSAPSLIFKPESTAWLEHWAARARSKHPGVKISARGAAAVHSAVTAQLHLVDSFPWLAISAPSQWTPVEVLQEWARVDERTVDQRVAEFIANNIAVTTEFLALRRSVFIKEALTAAHLDRVEPILPHAKHVADMRRAGGYLSGRRSLAKFAGIEQPKSQQLVEAEDGWQRMMSAATRAVRAGLKLLPASRSPLLTSCPGYSLLEELALLVHAGIPAATVFELAGGVAADVLAIPFSREPVFTAPQCPDEPAQILRLRATDASAFSLDSGTATR